jgi:hypothetical protein
MSGCYFQKMAGDEMAGLGFSASLFTSKNIKQTAHHLTVLPKGFQCPDQFHGYGPFSVLIRYLSALL